MFKITLEGIGVDKMSNNKKTAYPAEFKESAIKLALESGNSIAQTARELGVHEKTMYNWMHLYSKQKTVNKPDREMNHPFDEIKKLKKELAQVTQERDILKKATAYFAKECR
jgi:transposase